MFSLLNCSQQLNSSWTPDGIFEPTWSSSGALNLAPYVASRSTQKRSVVKKPPNEKCVTCDRRPYLEFRELLGLATVTSSKNILSCEKSKDMSFPRNILATKSPPGLRTWVVMLRAANRSWAWMYSSMSWRPVTSGAPSHTTISADRQVWPLVKIFSLSFCLLFVNQDHRSGFFHRFLLNSRQSKP